VNIKYILVIFKEMSTDEDIILAAAAFILVSEYEPPKKRRVWTRASLDRSKYNGNRMLPDYIQDNMIGFSPGEGIRSTFKNFLRMTCTDFEDILKIIGPKIKRQNTNFRVPISMNERWAVTLRFLASGDSFMNLSYLFKISQPSISFIVPEVRETLISSLKDYIKVNHKLFTFLIE